MLLSVNTLFIIRVLTFEATQTVKNRIDVSVYFTPTATDEQIQTVRSLLNSFPEINTAEYFDRGQVLEQFRTTHVDNKGILQSLDELGENPFGSTLILKTREPEDYKKIIQSLSVPEYSDIIETKTFADSERAINRITIITRQVERASVFLTIFFVLVAFLIIFNTIRVAIYTQRREISIKRLVGATNWFIRGPYIVEAILFTIFSMAITSLLVFFVAKLLDPFVSVVFEKSNILTTYFISNILLLLSAQFVAVLVLTIATSLLAMRRHLKV